jgi:hypothetical protein
MDEMFGYFAAHPANPPTKKPLLTLLKQARAFGLGLILATQNPVDLDYKGCPTPAPGSSAGCRPTATSSACWTGWRGAGRPAAGTSRARPWTA